MTPYEEPGSPTELKDSCEAVTRLLRAAADRALKPAPSIHFDEFVQDVPKKAIAISEAARKLAGAIHFHLD
ncbi:hypothetical protein [Nocardioides montaniterrae]